MFSVKKTVKPEYVSFGKHKDYSCAEMFNRKALKIGNKCELYSVEDKKNTLSWYTAGMFLETRDKNKGLDKLLSYIESL